MNIEKCFGKEVVILTDDGFMGRGILKRKKRDRKACELWVSDTEYLYIWIPTIISIEVIE